MKWITIPILTLLIISHTFSNWFVVLNFKLNQNFIANNICENRFQPKLNCKGNCALVKKLKQQEKQEQQNSRSAKVEISSLVLYSTSFYATVDPPVVIVLPSGIRNRNSGHPVDRAFTFFHPPSA